MSRHIHIVGIGGAGMSAIARVLHQRGDEVTGSDRERSTFSEKLTQEGVAVSYGHRAENIQGADLVLASAAIPEDNVELQAAHKAGLPVLQRHEFWPDLTEGIRTIAVAGTHGKTTTSGLIAGILEGAGRSPSFIIGAEMIDLGTNARAGRGEDFVIEADEYQLAFLGLHPQIAVITNVELDHPDQFKSEAAMLDAFQGFVDQVQQRLILCADEAAVMRLVAPGRQVTTYGLSSQADWRAEEIRPNGAGGSDFLVLKGEQVLGLVRTRLPGQHNVVNTLAALAVVDALGVSFVEAREALAEFHGTARRFQVLGEEAGVTVVDDYAHHPTEIMATLAAARQRFPDETLIAVFQPHTYSRTKRLIGEIAGAFSQADKVMVTDIFAAREVDDLGIDGALVASGIDHEEVRYVGGVEAASQQLLTTVAAGTVVITLSAGNGNQIGKLLLEGLRQKRGSAHGQEK
jgi:UDP-N-acetylmuramate--alanine ligase